MNDKIKSILNAKEGIPANNIVFYKTMTIYKKDGSTVIVDEVLHAAIEGDCLVCYRSEDRMNGYNFPEVSYFTVARTINSEQNSSQ